MTNEGTSADRDFRKRKNTRGEYLWHFNRRCDWSRDWRATFHHIVDGGSWRWLRKERR
jgi:hypothetical protein